MHTVAVLSSSNSGQLGEETEMAEDTKRGYVGGMTAGPRSRQQDDIGDDSAMEPTIDNQINQPDRFHNREPKGESGTG